MVNEEKYDKLVKYILHKANESKRLDTYGLVRDEFYKEGLLKAYEGILGKIAKLDKK